MKIKCHVGVGLVGCVIRETVEIPDADLEGMDKGERDSYVEAYIQEWAMENVEWGYKVVSENGKSG